MLFPKECMSRLKACQLSYRMCRICTILPLIWVSVKHRSNKASLLMRGTEGHSHIPNLCCFSSPFERYNNRMCLVQPRLPLLWERQAKTAHSHLQLGCHKSYRSLFTNCFCWRSLCNNKTELCHCSSHWGSETSCLVIMKEKMKEIFHLIAHKRHRVSFVRDEQIKGAV